MKIWVDDVRPAPGDCFHEQLWCGSVNSVILAIEVAEENGKEIEVIDLDHDAGDYFCMGGDYINILKWLEETGRSYPIHIHSMNPVGVENMRRIIERNGWEEVK